MRGRQVAGQFSQPPRGPNTNLGCVALSFFPELVLPPRAQSRVVSKFPIAEESTQLGISAGTVEAKSTTFAEISRLQGISRSPHCGRHPQISLVLSLWSPGTIPTKHCRLTARWHTGRPLEAVGIVETVRGSYNKATSECLLFLGAALVFGAACLARA